MTHLYPDTLIQKSTNYFLTHRVLPISKYLHPGACLIDIGCGAGVFVRFMRDRGFDAKGLDISQSSVQIGKKHLNLNDYLSVGNWEALPNIPTYDAITAWTVIEHLLEPEAFVQRCREALKPNGLLLLEFPTVDSLLYRIFESLFFWVMPPYHLVLFSRLGIQKLLARQGFEIMTIYPMPQNWYFSDCVARRCGVHLDKVCEQAPEARSIFKEIDRIFDLIALQQDQASSIQIICRKI
ncbi:class I SAM-dependent methyltransferase [Thermosynechococcus sp. PP42]|uniref:class I SAM-dependent methyltransferase n=1 Tax=Thermosynechococcus sp. PP42 TaxID=3074083 RepID=UPI00285615AE|nr:class I SAM-dependent methyltransferase [Thermosynechococcus sp. PP42]MDR5637913.1 class I SAM-dependent methyltransferase [Thermosynechococcus sp. PP42]